MDALPRDPKGAAAPNPNAGACVAASDFASERRSPPDPLASLEADVSALKRMPHARAFVGVDAALAALLRACAARGGDSAGSALTVIVDADNRRRVARAAGAAMTVLSYQRGGATDLTRTQTKTQTKTLARTLKRVARSGAPVVVFTDSIRRSDGEVAPLPELLEILFSYPGVVLAIDDAGAGEALGPTGGGVFEHFGLEPADAVALGVTPALITRAPGDAAVLSVSCPALAAQVTKACAGASAISPDRSAEMARRFRRLRRDPSAAARRRALARHLHVRLWEAGLETDGDTHIVSTPLPRDVSAEALRERLRGAHWRFLGDPMTAEAADASRLRLVVAAKSARDELDRLAEAVAEALEALSPVPRRTEPSSDSAAANAA